MSASRTWLHPAFTVSRMVSSAWSALRRGRNPNDEALKPASKIGSMTSFTPLRAAELPPHPPDPILHRRNAQRPQLPVGLGNPPPQHGRRLVGACVELAGKLREEPPDAVLLHRLERDPVHARGALVAADAAPRFPQDVTPVDSVVQRVEPALPMLLGCSVELALESSDFVDRR